jgi:RND family efflux transporter MFP subunit
MNRTPSALAGLIAATVLLLTGCGKKHQPGVTEPATAPTAQVRVQAAESKREPLTEEVVGTVRAKLHATLEAKVSGRIEQLPVVLGQRVKAGDLVARLDAVEIKARLDQARASLEQADRDWKRISALFKGQAVTQSELDNAQARQQVAKAGVAEAEAMMRYLEVRAPFDGVVSRKWADVGDLASPGKPLVEIEDPSVLQIDADIPEAIASQVHLGASLAVRLDNRNGPLPGKVAEIAPAADPASRTVRIKVDVPPAPGLMPGQFARVLVPVGESNSLDVPASSVVQRGQLEMVFVVTNRQAHLHLVKTGKRVGDQVEILSGLDAGDPVAVEGAPLLADGQTVEVKP